MKKLLILFALSLVAVTSHAQRIRVASGSLDSLRTAATMGATFTYDNMQVGKLRESDYIDRKVEDYNKDEAGRGDTWRESWIGDREERYQPKFLELFNKYMTDRSRGGGITLIADDGEPRYRFAINTYFTEPGFNVGIMRQNASITLEIDVIDRLTGSTIARVLVENASANSFTGFDFETGYRIQECYAKAGREFAKYLIKELRL